MALLLELIGQYGILFVFAWVLIEQAGAPIPAYPALLVAGSLAAAGTHSALAFLAAAVVACLIADALWYAIGMRFGGRVLRVLCRLSLSPDGCVRQTQSIFERWGAPSLIFAKFIPGFASIATAMAGSTGIGRVAFFAYDVIGASLWAAAGLGLGWLFADAVADVLLVLEQLGQWGLVLLVLCLAAFIASKAWRRHRFHAKLRMSRISVTALAHMLERGEAPLVVDVRSSLERGEGRIPGAIVLDGEAWPDGLRVSTEDAVVVVYCDCPDEVAAALAAKELTQLGFTRVRPLAGGIAAWKAAGLSLEPWPVLDATR